MKTSVALLVPILGTAESFSSRCSPSMPSASSLRSSNDDDALLPFADAMDRRSAIVGAVGTVGAAFVASFVPSEALALEKPSGGRGGIPEWTLEGGVRFPTLALNTVGLSADETEAAVRSAVAEGATHIDFHPGKERDGVAQYVAKEGREGLFLNTKIRKAPPGTSPKDAAERARAQIDEDLKALGLDGVDMLMLRDSPDREVIQAQWAVLEEALAAGKTRSLGVINFCEGALAAVLETAKVKPALNYYMLHVGMGRDPRGLRTFGESRGIRSFAYGAVGEPGPNEELLSSPAVAKIAKAHNKTPEQVALRWVLQTGAAASVRPTLNFGLGTGSCTDPSCGEGIQKRFSSYNWSLSAREMKQLDALTSPDDNPTLFSSAGCPDAFVMPK